jgi:uridine kinase
MTIEEQYALLEKQWQWLLKHEDTATIKEFEEAADLFRETARRYEVAVTRAKYDKVFGGEA